MQIPETEKKLIESLLEKCQQSGVSRERAVLVEFAEMYDLLNSSEQELCDRFLHLDPKQFGFKGEFLGIKPVPKELASIQGQHYTDGEKTEEIKTQYVPKQVFEALEKMRRKLEADTSKKILVASGYRSPAYQLYIFLRYLKSYDWDIEKTASRVALPGYSEHGDPDTAVDFVTQDGIPTDEDPAGFAKTPEYEWLVKNANAFGFYLSYPENNQLGVMFEPWHWRFIVK